jgi:hypothetical protein
MAASTPEIAMDPFLAEYCGDSPITTDKLLRSIDAAEAIVSAFVEEEPSLPSVEHGSLQLIEIRGELEDPSISSVVIKHAAQRLDFQYRNNLWKPLRAGGQETKPDSN